MQGEGKTKKLLKPGGYGVKVLSHFVDLYHQLPEEYLLKWIVRVTNEEQQSFFGVEWCAVEEHVCFDAEPQLTIEQSPMAVHDPDTHQVIPNVTVATVNSEKRH